jgi:signal peptidase I
VVLLASIVAVGLRLFVVQTFFVPSGSMIPTLQIGDRILVQKLGYSLDRGAIVVFRTPPGDTGGRCGPQTDSDLVKRIIGLPGETISSQGNTIYIDHKPLSQPWLPKHDPLGPTPIHTTVIPPGNYYMLGDNRADSCDSRYWGTVPRSYIVGRVFLVVWRNGHPVVHPI